MSIATDLEKLVELRRIGILNQLEFDKAKARLLDEKPAVRPSQIDPEKFAKAFSNFPEKRADADEVADAVYTKFRNHEKFKSVVGVIIAVIMVYTFYCFTHPSPFGSFRIESVHQ